VTGPFAASPQSRFQSTANELKAPWATVEHTDLFESRNIAYGVCNSSPPCAFFSSRKLTGMFSLYASGPLGLPGRCAVAFHVVSAGIYCGLPSCLLNPRWQSVEQWHLVVFTTLSSSTTGLWHHDTEGTIFAILFLLTLPLSGCL